jgi:ribosomal-protein-alanine N-acetyltransferase
LLGGSCLVSITPDSSLGNGQQPAAYFLRSERLGFRLWSEADIELATALWGDPEVTRLIGGPFSPEQVRERLSRELATAQSHGVQYWPIFLLTTGEHVGCCGLRPYKADEGVCEIGVHVRRACWGHGYAPEATRAVMAYAFRSLGVRALFAGHNPANGASRRILAQLGFRYTHDEFYPPTGLHHPSYLLTAGEFGQKGTEVVGSAGP